MPNRISRIERDRTRSRAIRARRSVLHLLDAADREGIEIVPIGSLANGRFGPHSDVDLLVRGEVDTPGRVRIERLVASALRASGLPYDLIFAADLTPDRLQEFERDLVEPSRLREAWSEADPRAAGARQP